MTTNKLPEFLLFSKRLCVFFGCENPKDVLTSKKTTSSHPQMEKNDWNDTPGEGGRREGSY